MSVPQLRTRRRVLDAFEDDLLNALDEQQRIEIVERSADVYDRRLDRDVVENRSGRHRGAIEHSSDATVAWLRSIGEYVENAFGTTRYVREPFAHSAAAARAVRSGRGPVVVLLPRNDRGDLAPYVLAQCLLAGCPFVAVPSTREASTYVAETYVESLREACNAVLEEAAAVEEAFAVDPISGDRAEKFDGLATLVTDRSQLVAFGSDAGIDGVLDRIRETGTEPATVVRMGSGYSTSAVLAPDERRIEEYCEQICASAVFDRGDDCTTTNVLYVDEDVYDGVLDGIRAARERIVPGEDFVPPSQEQLDSRPSTVGGPPGKCDDAALPIVELAASDPIDEYPVPILQVKSVDDVEAFVETMTADLGSRRSLALSVFTETVDVTELAPRVPAHLVKENRPTHRIDLLVPHQGRFLVSDLVETTYVERATGNE